MPQLPIIRYPVKVLIAGCVIVNLTVTACAPSTPIPATSLPDAATPLSPQPTEPASPTSEPLTATIPPTSTTLSDVPITAASVADLRETLSLPVSDKPVVAGALAPDTHRGATLDAERNLRLWDTDTGQMVLDLGQQEADGFGLAYSPDGTMLASGGGFQIKFWDAATGAFLRSVTTNVLVFRLIWSPDSKRIAVVGDSSSHAPIIDVATAQVVDTLDAPDGNVLWTAAFAPDGSRLAIGDYEGHVTVLRLEDKQFSAYWLDDRLAVWDLDFSPDNAVLIACNADGSLIAWKAGTWADDPAMTKSDAHAKHAGCADGAFTPDGSIYFSAGLDGRLVAWDVATGTELAEQSFGIPIWSVSVSGDATRLALGLDNGEVKVLRPIGSAANPPTPVPTTIAPQGIVEIEDVPTLPQITGTVAIDAFDVPKKCGGKVFRHYDVYYSVDYGGDLSKEQRRISNLNLDIVSFYNREFAAQDWLGFKIGEPQYFSSLESIYWEEEDRPYPAAADQPPYVGTCYRVTVLVQPPGADLEIIADIEKEE